MAYFKQENLNLKTDINFILEKQEEERIKRNEIELVSPFASLPEEALPRAGEAPGDEEDQQDVRADDPAEEPASAQRSGATALEQEGEEE